MGGSPFDRGNLYMLLTNPLYAGQMRYKHELHPGEHEAIIDPELFRKVQTQLKQNSLNGGSAARNKHGALLRGLLVCKACGRAMTHTFTSRGQRRYRYYTCTRAIKSGRQSCGGLSLPAAEIEQAVVNEIRGIGADPALRWEVYRQARALADQEQGETVRERRDLKRQLAQDHAEVRKLATRGQRVASTTARIAELQDRITRTEARLADLGAAVPGQPEITSEYVDAAFAQFDNVWEQLSPREQSRLLSLLINQVEFDAAHDRFAIRFHATAITTLAQEAAA
jgi:site-specific DNA recombinase